MGQPKIVAEFDDRFGDRRIVHRDNRGRLMIKRNGSTPTTAVNHIIGPIIGKKIRTERIKRNWSLAYLCQKAGIVSATPKSRMWEIENYSRKGGMRLGTLFVIAIALDMNISDLLPDSKEVMKIAGLEMKTPNLPKKILSV